MRSNPAAGKLPAPHDTAAMSASRSICDSERSRFSLIRRAPLENFPDNSLLFENNRENNREIIFFGLSVAITVGLFFGFSYLR